MARDSNRIYIVAEMSANHNQDYERAEAIIYSAKEAGADAVKLQTYTPDTMTIDSDRLEFRVSGGTPWDGETLYNLYKRAYMPWEWQPKLKELADSIEIDLFSTAYDRTSVDFLEDMGVPIHKISSYELTDLPLIEYVASKKKPLILSTGMATLSEIKNAVNTARDNGVTDITLLKCVSAYPAPPDEMNLRSIGDLCLQFVALRDVRIDIGLSDHTLGSVVPLIAVAFGISMIEKHFTLSRNEPSPDSSFSMEPDEFNKMIGDIRIAELSLGSRALKITGAEENSKKFRRSLFVVKDMKAGDIFTDNNVKSIRPEYGLSPKYLLYTLGRKATKDIERGTPLDWDLLI